MTIRLSGNLAVFIGLIAPILETIRRWHTWTEDPPSLFDDYILGGLLLYGAWRVSKDPIAGQRFLTAGWGFALGLAYASFFFQLHQYRIGAGDPAPVPAEWVLIVKGIGSLLVALGFVSSLRKITSQP